MCILILLAISSRVAYLFKKCRFHSMNASHIYIKLPYILHFQDVNLWRVMGSRSDLYSTDCYLVSPKKSVFLKESGKADSLLLECKGDPVNSTPSGDWRSNKNVKRDQFYFMRRSVDRAASSTAIIRVFELLSIGKPLMLA